ncbi:MAG: hypothetical protein LQ349_004230 [Xanthoria aureola]|nr:MAG: hypothetical protein LQ349_004230 [Xanthoria aureola]
MEVFVRNLPQEATEKQVKQYFRPILADLSINVFHCQKPRNKGYAKITIFDRQLGQRFLAVHGQLLPGLEGFKTVKKQLRHMNRPLNCSLSNNAPDEYVLKSLEREQVEKTPAQWPPVLKPKAQAVDQKRTRRSFDFDSIYCGALDYIGSDLAFVPYYGQTRSGRLIFGRRFVLVDFNPSIVTLSAHQMEIPYSNILSMMTGSSTTPSVTFSLALAPRFYEKVPLAQNTLVEEMNRLGLKHYRKTQNVPERRRTIAFDPSHRAIVANCLCYRFQVSPDDVACILALKRLPGYPDIIPWELAVLMKSPFHAQMTSLNGALNATQYQKYPFELKFQLQRLAQNGYLPPYKVIQLMQIMAQEFVNADNLSLADAVRKLACYIPYPGGETEATELSLPTLRDLLLNNYDKISREKEYSKDLSTKYEQIAMVYKAMVTPAGIYLSGPEPEMKNRVLRKYSAFTSFFLQVNFADEDGEPIRYDRTTSLDGVYHERFKVVLEGNITIAGRPYEFLGFSHSSLRAQTCWFMAPFVWEGDLRHARAVIKDLGDFSAIRSPAKCAARIGQAFSQAFSSVKIPGHAFRRLPEVENVDADKILRTFSDGVGTCSKAILKLIWAAYAQSRTWKPTVCQIRYAGAKGMISLDDRLEGEVLCLRPSMIKFEAISDRIEICGAGFKPLNMYLNRQLIKILEDLGVPDRSFLDLQDEAVEQLRITTENPINAGYYLQRNDIGKAAKLSWLVRKLFYIGMSFSDDGFLRDTLELAVLIQLRKLKYRSRIYVERGMTVYGIMDETGFLDEGQIYCSVQNEKSALVLTGRVVITRSPAMHPGDVQCVTAVEVPPNSPLRSVHNCVVFSSKGDRDLPSQLSGGDLDGDLYNVIYDNTLMPKMLSTPADYETATPIDIHREVLRSDMTEFFVKFMENDQLGRLATLHQTLADQKPQGVFDPDCILLAEMCSTAVDFSKTGIPVDLTKIPRSSNVKPDFQAPGPRVLIEKSIAIEADDEQDGDEDDDVVEEAPATRYYESTKVLGQLYRAIDEHAFFEQIQRQSRSMRTSHRSSLAEQLWQYVRRETALMQYEHYLPFARDTRDAYEDNLADTILENSFHPTHFVSEVEVFAGELLGKYGAPNKRQRETSTSMKEKHDRDVAYTVQCILHGEEDDVSKAEALERSIACLDVAVHERGPRMRFGRLVSFTWVAAAVCLREVEKFIGS